MTEASKLPYYPRFVFNFSDGNCFSTADLELFKHVKEHNTEYQVSRFKKGQKVDVTWEDDNEDILIKTYNVSEIEIHQIKEDIDEPTYGINLNDCQLVSGDEKKWLMEIYVFFDYIEE